MNAFGTLSNVKRLIFSLLTFVVFSMSAVADPECVNEVIASIRSLGTSSRAERALGRAILDSEKAAIDRAIQTGNPIGYTAMEVRRQKQILEDAGFSSQEIETLRKKLVLGDWQVTSVDGASAEVSMIQADIRPLDQHALKRAQSGQDTFYFVDLQGNLHVSDTFQAPPADSAWLLSKSGSKKRQAYVVREAGQLEYLPGRNEFQFRPKYSIGLSDDEIQQTIDQANDKFPKRDFFHPPVQNQQQVQALRCLDIMKRQEGFGDFFFKKIATDNAVYFTAIAISEIEGSKRLSSQDGRDVLFADLVGNNVSSVSHAVLGAALVNGNASFPVSFGLRTGLSLGTIMLQNQLIYPAILQRDAKQRADKIRNFDFAWTVGKMAFNTQFDKFILQELPRRLVDSCMKGSNMSLVFSPGMVRIYEKTGSTAIYYVTRQALIGQ